MKNWFLFFLSMHFFGLLNAQWTSDGSNIYNSNANNVGVGTTLPNAKLHVGGSPNILQFLVQPSSTGNAFAKIASNGNGHAFLNIDANFASYINFLSGGVSKWQIGRPTSTYDFSIFNSNLNITSFFIQSSTGNVGIGTSDTKGFRLAVNGDAIFTKVKVKQYGNWPDYVFSPEFKLPALDEIEKYIIQHKHLPGIPSAIEIEKNGLDVGESQALLLKKIEELTLYLIELKKENEKMNQRILHQEKKINELKNLMN